MFAVEIYLHIPFMATTFKDDVVFGVDCVVKFYARLVIIYIAIFCIFASKFAEKAFVYRKKNN